MKFEKDGKARIVKLDDGTPIARIEVLGDGDPVVTAAWPKLGDVVRLKSGGPDMVVCDPGSPFEVVCVWFDGDGHRVEGDFPVEGLVKA